MRDPWSRNCTPNATEQLGLHFWCGAKMSSSGAPCVGITQLLEEFAGWKQKPREKEQKTGGGSRAVCQCDVCRCLCGSRSNWVTSEESSLGCIQSLLTLNASWWHEKRLKNRRRGKEGVARHPKTSERIRSCRIYVLYILICINIHLIFISLLF